MSKAAKARLPGERRGHGGRRKREGTEWKRQKQTEAGVNYGCNLRYPRGKERQRETSSHAYQIAHLPHFLIMVREQTCRQSVFLCVCVCVWEREWEREIAFINLSISSCVELCCAVKPSLYLIWRVCLQLSWLPLHYCVVLLCIVSACVYCLIASDTHTHRHSGKVSLRHLNRVIVRLNVSWYIKCWAFDCQKCLTLNMRFACLSNSKLSKSERSCRTTTSHPHAPVP